MKDTNIKDDEQYEAVIKALYIIEKYISEKKEYDFIRDEVYKECGYEKKYFNTIFKKYLKCSVSEYIRTMSVINTYRAWLKEKKDLPQRATYKGFEYFALHFKRLFGEDLKEANEKSILLKAPNTKEELMKLKYVLEALGLFRFYLFTEEEVGKLLKDKELLQEYLINFLTIEVDENRDGFREKEEYGDYSFMEGLEWNQRRVDTFNSKIEEIQFEVDEEKQLVTGKAWASYDVSADATSFYFSEDEEIRYMELGRTRSSSGFYFDIYIDKSNLEKSRCEIEVC